MERTSCFGKCPAYQVEIKSNGDVYYLGIKDAEFDGSIKGKLSMAEFAKLKKKYMKYDFLKLPSHYKVMASDFSKVHYTLTVNGKVKSIKNANEGPEYLMELCQDIENLIGKKIVWNKKSFVKNKGNENKNPPITEEINNNQPVAVEVTRIEEFTDENNVLLYAEKMPEFPGGQSSMMDFIREKLIYPEMAKENGVQGKVNCSFIVGKDGTVYGATILRGIGSACDQEALRVINKMPRWKPGMQNGKAVNVKFNLPINFKLQ